MGFTEILQAQGLVEAPTAEVTKPCSRCRVVKPASEFTKNRHKGDGLCSNCKECERRRKAEQKLKPKVHEKEKRCSKCNEIKPQTDFSKDAICRDGLRSHCKECVRAARIALRERRLINKPQEQRCSKCGIVKRAAEFYNDPDRPTGLRRYCRECGALDRRMRAAMRHLLKTKPHRGADLATWEQVEQVVGEMSHLQGMINVERYDCDERVALIKKDAVARIAPYVLQQATLQVLVDRFVKKIPCEQGRLKRECRYGTVCKARGRVDITLNVPGRKSYLTVG